MSNLNHHQSFILDCLRSGSLRGKEIIKSYDRMSQVMGLPVSFSGTDKGWTFHRRLDNNLEELNDLGLVECEEGTYSMTPSGRKKADEYHEKIASRHQRLRSLVRSPESASIISVITNSAMAALKLIAGFVFNSVALIADGFDSLVDVVSAITVFLGIKCHRELASSTFIIAMMFGTTGYIGYEAVGRLISPEPLIPSSLAIITAVISGGVCYLMSIYQHYIGKSSASISLLTQSVDSRNHTFQAVAVLIGLGFAAFGIFVVDAVVALLVAGLIFKSAVELVLETLRIAKGEELEPSRFNRKYEEAVSKRREEFFRFWVLLALNYSGTREELIGDYENTFNCDEVQVKPAVHPMAGFDFKDNFDPMLRELEEDDLVRLEGQKISLTVKGKRLSSSRVRRAKFGIPI